MAGQAVEWEQRGIGKCGAERYDPPVAYGPEDLEHEFAHVESGGPDRWSGGLRLRRRLRPLGADVVAGAGPRFDAAGALKNFERP
jgi:hypothetical protein